MGSVLVPRLVAIAAMGAIPWQAAGAAAPDSINVGYGGTDLVPTMAHCNSKVYSLEYEHPIGPATSLLGRGSLVDYSYDNMTYREHGILRGADLGLRHYSADGMRGWFAGASLGYWYGGWIFSHNMGTAAAYQGTAYSRSARLNFELGNRIPVGSGRVSIAPHADIGKFFTSRSCTYDPSGAVPGAVCTQKPEVNAYLFVGIAIDVSL